jgi:hypothetical protein
VRNFLIWLALLAAICSAFVLIVFAEGVWRAVGFVLMSSELAAVMILDRRRPDWRESWRRRL